MNPLFLRFGFGLIVAVVTCVVAYRSYRRQQSLLQPTFSRFDGSDITICCICLEQLATVSESRLVSLPCKHKFHKSCIRMVFAQVRSCPLCREKVDSAFVESILKV